MTQVYTKKPDGFSPIIEVAACYLEIDGKLLLVQRSAHKSEPGTWSVPAGKIEANESPEQGALRELFEETGIALNSMEHFGTLYIRKPDIDYVYHQYKKQLDEAPQVFLSDEHQAYQWAIIETIPSLPLMEGAKEALIHYQSIGG